jgi:hypothetical protein
MTHPTKAIFFTLVKDFANLAANAGEEQLFTSKDVEDAMDRIEVLDFDQTIDVDGIKVNSNGQHLYEGQPAACFKHTACRKGPCQCTQAPQTMGGEGQ